MTRSPFTVSGTYKVALLLAGIVTLYTTLFSYVPIGTESLRTENGVWPQTALNHWGSWGAGGYV